ncbi:MAG TPA: HAD-IA family hydrolase [Stellaceae bacterium]|jgi:2-haloalkanoic acid dehalogenase type II|nr:HAD-IA family hydrolase [Stellaceae bacterium]
MPRRYDAVLFDLLTALLDSWSLWNDVASGEEAGLRWRREYLRRTYGTTAYRPYEVLVAEAAREVGLDLRLADTLAARYGELKPWPGVAEELGTLAASGVKLGVATNCSEPLGRIAAECIGSRFDVVVTAERAGFYKPDPHPYRMALAELAVTPERCLFVAGSAYDLVGASRVGLDTWWHDRIGMTRPPEAPDPLRHTGDLAGLADFVANSP